MNILFCNIAWMKYYKGVMDIDRPINGGAFVAANDYGNEVYNFQNYNGNCYGFVMLNGDMSLQSHFEGVSASDSFVDDVLVVWVATDKNSETRIVGWYSNATLYREEQFEQAFFDESHDLSYRMKARADNCFLVPEDERDFKILRAAQEGTGKGMGRSNIWYAESEFAKENLIPRVVAYIKDYQNKHDSLVFNDDIFSQNLKDIDETPELFISTANSYLNLLCFDKAIENFEKAIELEGNKLESLWGLMQCYDFKRDRIRTLEYGRKLLDLEKGIDLDFEDKIFICCVMFDIYVSQNDKLNAKKIADEMLTYSDDENTKEMVKEMLSIINGDL